MRRGRDKAAREASSFQQAAAFGRRLVGVHQHSPRGTAAEAAPRHLGRGMADRETHLADGGHQGISLVDPEAPTSLEVIGAEERQGNGPAHQAPVDQWRPVGHQHGQDRKSVV